MRATRKANSLSQWDDNMPFPQGSMPNRALQRLEERARSGAGQPRWERSDSNPNPNPNPKPNPNPSPSLNLNQRATVRIVTLVRRTGQVLSAGSG